MDKELEEILKELKGVLGELLDDKKLDKIKKVEKAFEKAHKEKAIISIEKDKNGEAQTRIEGGRLTLLITLAGLEKSVLEKLDCCEREFELIKSMTGTREAE